MGMSCVCLGPLLSGCLGFLGSELSQRLVIGLNGGVASHLRGSYLRKES